MYVPHTIEKQERINDPLLTRFKYYQYDTHGNILEQSKANDVLNTYIWGYNNTFPVAEVTGASYNDVIVLLNQNVLQNPFSDQVLRDELQKIRQNFPYAVVTSFTYKPLVGITSVTDVRNSTTYYEYDNFGRLQRIKDRDNNIVRAFDYKYQEQQ